MSKSLVRPAIRLAGRLILGDKLEPDNRNGEQAKRDDQRGERVGEVHVIGAGLKPGKETRKAARGLSQ